MSSEDMKLNCSNSHIIETLDVYEGRMPAKLAQRAPRVEIVDGGAVWFFEDVRVPILRCCTAERSIIAAPPLKPDLIVLTGLAFLVDI